MESHNVTPIACETIMMLERAKGSSVAEADYTAALTDIDDARIAMSFGLYGRSSTRVDVVLTSKLERRFHNVLPHARRRSKHCLALTFELHHRTSTAAMTRADESDPANASRMLVANEVARSLYLVILAMNIAFPGCANLLGGAIFVDGDYELGLDTLDAREFYLHRVSRSRWPHIQTIPFSRVWRWINHVLDAPDGDMRVAPAGRALNALSHLLAEPYSRAVVLMWAMVGIEAIYTSGSGGLVQQVRDRAQSFLGTGERSAKLVSSMYNLRSRFVHGDMDFGGAHEMGRPAHTALSELSIATDLATALLLATIQELVRRDWLGVDFETTCREARLPNDED